MKDRIRLAAIHSRTIYSKPQGDDWDYGFAIALKQKNVDKMCDFLHEAGRQRADIVATHECFDAVKFGTPLEDREQYLSLVDEIPGQISDRMKAIARKYNMNIIANYHERQDDKIYNTSVLIDRMGRISGKYRKIHLPPSEKWNVTAGDEFTVLQSDIGMIGFATCYDIKFPEHCRALALNGADFIFHQTMGWGVECQEVGEALVRIRAAENCVYLIVSKNIQKVNSKNGKSCIISNHGEILAETGGVCEKVVIAEIQPDMDCIQKDHFNALFSGIESVRARTLLERRSLLYDVLTDKKPPLFEKYRELESYTTTDKVSEIAQKIKRYNDDIKNNRPIERNYHW